MNEKLVLEGSDAPPPFRNWRAVTVASSGDTHYTLRHIGRTRRLTYDGRVVYGVRLAAR